jgi:CRISPR-associated protein Csm3
MHLIEIRQIQGHITLLSGLHIGAGDTELHIGGIDKSVVCHPHTRHPYIPGSSLKGKTRSLLEMRSGCMAKTSGKPLRFIDLKKYEGQQKTIARNILQLFGTSGADKGDAQEIGPARGSFSDCFLSEEWTERAMSIPLTEIKAETAIDRISGTAQRGSLRLTERVVADVKFSFSISLKVMSDDPDLSELLLKGLKLLELDALGGSGSRGYGRVKFTFSEPADFQNRFDAIVP